MEQLLTWALTAMSITGVILNVKKNRMCFVIWVIANMGWITINILHEIYAQAFLFVIYTGLSVWGWIEWSKDRGTTKDG